MVWLQAHKSPGDFSILLGTPNSNYRGLVYRRMLDNDVLELRRCDLKSKVMLASDGHEKKSKDIPLVFNHLLQTIVDVKIPLLIQIA